MTEQLNQTEERTYYDINILDLFGEICFILPQKSSEYLAKGSYQVWEVVKKMGFQSDNLGLSITPNFYFSVIEIDGIYGI